MAGKEEKEKMLISHRGKINNKGFVLLRGLIAMFITLLCLAAILFSLSTISRGSSVLREEVNKEINQRNEDAMRGITG